MFLFDKVNKVKIVKLFLVKKIIYEVVNNFVKRNQIRRKLACPVSERKPRVELVKEKITSIYFNSKRYGNPRMNAELASLGNKLSRITITKYISQLGLRSIFSKKFKVTSNSKHKYLVVPNILNREFSVTESSKGWLSDFTYIRVKEGFINLTTVLDLYNRKIIGWSLSDGMSAEETSLAAWRVDSKNRTIEKDYYFILTEEFNMPVRSLPMCLILIK